MFCFAFQFSFFRRKIERSFKKKKNTILNNIVIVFKLF